MIRPDPHRPIPVYLCVEPVDFRKQISGLATLVQDTLALNPFAEQLYVFRNRRRDQCRMLYWERNGFVLWSKRLEREHFAWPRADSPVVTLGVQELNLLLDGYDIFRIRPHRPLHFEVVA